VTAQVWMPPALTIRKVRSPATGIGAL
jgi:hypothetical protein